ncbi:hypothetical protein QTG56_23330 (plasmid) [Rossellomorea sp. AcN35-11]|nr:hypothetical protein [Rossellomorea aquimaris]WJV32298.1 hypothetical protein QTG56_23330 [Rossellomorea sp. AcN35-11]
MFKNRTTKNDLEYVIERTSLMKDLIMELYNKLHSTAYIQKTELLKNRINNPKTYNKIFLELNTVFQEIKNNPQPKKIYKKIEEAERTLTQLELSFMKVKNIKISSTDKPNEDHSLKTNQQLKREVIEHYLSLSPQYLAEEVTSYVNRKNAYQGLITQFLKDIEENEFILEELEVETAKHLTKLSEQISTSINEEQFWNDLSPSIAKHYIVPVFLEELIKNQ